MATGCLFVDGVPAASAALNALDWKNSVRAGTTAAQVLATDFEVGDVIDGVVLALDDRILIKNQAAGAENGIYRVNAAGAPTRTDDANTNAEVTSGMTTLVEEGTVNADTAWTLTTNDPITLGVTALVFAQWPTTNPPLSTVLTVENTTGGTNIEVTGGDQIVSQAATDLTLNPAGDLIVTIGSQVLLGGAAAANAPADADDLIIGDGTGSPGMYLFGDAAGFATYAMGQISGTSRGFVRYIFATDRIGFGVANTERMILGTTELRPNADGGLSLGIAGVGWTFACFDEQAVAPVAPAADHGAFWVRNDAPNTAMFTDDIGNDHPVSLMPTLELRPVTGEPATLLGGVLTVDGASDIRTMDYADGASALTTYWTDTLPREYSTNGLTVRIFYSGTVASVANIHFEVGFERHETVTPFDINTSSFAANQVVDTPGPGTIGALQQVDIAFTNAQIDGLLAGEPFRVRVVRDPTDVADLYAGTAQVLHVQILENP